MRRQRRSTGDAPIVLVTFPDYDTDHPQHGGALTAAGYTMRIAPKLGARSPEELLALSADVAGAIVSTDPFTRDVLRDSTALQVIARVGVGIDSIDADAATELGVAITTTPGANEETVADHALALMLALLRRVAENDAGVRRGEWNRTGPHTPRQLTGCTVGLVGYGHIGQLVARRLAGFDVRLLVSDPALGNSDSPRSVELAELLAHSDVVSLHCPLIPATRHLIDDGALQLMRPHAVLVNTSRGGVVDEAALIRALGEGLIAGAALDVFETEPPGSSPLMTMRNVVVSPHVGGLSTKSVDVMTRQATASVIDVIEGGVPEGLVNRSILE
ncbi:MAG TPA: phosphoglycerate dehydrogenase [Ilumatobacteraceae bacterium]|jgi:phosphoglycerate dehydrogenase-like enzyme